MRIKLEFEIIGITVLRIREYDLIDRINKEKMGIKQVGSVFGYKLWEVREFKSGSSHNTDIDEMMERS